MTELLTTEDAICRVAAQALGEPLPPFACSWEPASAPDLLRKMTWKRRQVHSIADDPEHPGWKIAKSRDPQIIFPGGLDTLEPFGALLVEIAVEADRSSTMLELFLAPDGGTHCEEQKLTTMIQADGRVRSYLVPFPKTLNGKPLGEFSRLRLDPMGCAGRFTIRTCRLLPRSLSPTFERRRSVCIYRASTPSWTEASPDSPPVVVCPNPADDLAYGRLDLTLAVEAGEGDATTLVAFVDDQRRLIDRTIRSLRPVSDGQPHELSFNVPGEAKGFSAVFLVPLVGPGRFRLHQATIHPKRYRSTDPVDGVERPLVYVHIPKTGGNSINQFLCACLPAESVLECRRPGDNLIDRAPLDEFAVVTGHFGHKALELFKTSTPRVMTVLREPVDQVTSFYYYLRALPWLRKGFPGFRRVMDLVHGESLLAFIQSELPNARMISDNHQTWKIGHGAFRWGGIRFVPRDRPMLEQAKANLARYDVVGLQEDLLNTVLLMCYRFDLPIRDVRLPRLNVNRERRGVEELSPEVLEAIQQRNLLDLELYDFGRELFEKQVQEMIEDVGQEQYDAWLHRLQPAESRKDGPTVTPVSFKPPRAKDRSADRFLQAALKCAACGAPQLTRANDHTLRCPECRRDYAVSEGLPCVNPDGSFTKLTKDDYNRTHQIDTQRREAVFGVWREILALIDAPRDRTLEIGCGTGLLSYGLAKYGGYNELHLSDISPAFVHESLAQAEPFDTPTFGYVCDGNNLPFATDSFDLVVGNSILHHLLQYAQTIQQTHDILSAEGAAIFAEPLLDSKALTALFAKLMMRIDDEFGLGVLEERDREGLQRAIKHWTVIPTLKHNPQRLQQIEDKYIFSRAEMETLAHQCGFRSFAVHNFEKPITVPIAPNYMKYTVTELSMHGLAPEKVQRFAYLFDCFSETYGSMLAGQVHTPLVFFVFRK